MSKLMERIYRKNPLTLALVWIGAYVVLMSLADGLSDAVGVSKSVTVIVSAVLTAMLLGWVRTGRRAAYFGLAKPDAPAAIMLYYLPLAVMISVNLWHGVALNMSPVETVLYMVSMLFVGVLEEVIFRGLLFRAMAKDSMKAAVIVSSVTFGVGHIVNLLSGAPLLDSLLQIVYATAVGFLFTVMFLRTGSIVPCIVCHSVLNALSAVANESVMTTTDNLISAAVLTVIPAAYALFIMKKTTPRTLPCE